MSYVLKTGYVSAPLNEVFVASAPQLKGETPIRPGDTVFVWFFEHRRVGAAGIGLTARGTVEAVENQPNSNVKQLHVRVTRLLTGARFGVEQLLANASQLGGLERKIRGYSHTQIRALTQNEASHLDHLFG